MFEHLGLEVTRAIPNETLAGLAAKTLKLHGGVVRDTTGKIVAHLALPVKAGLSQVPVLGSVLDTINTFQLERLSQQVREVLSISLLNTALSGLNLATSIVGFSFLALKMKQIDGKLEAMAKDVKDIKRILQSRQRAQLLEAVDALELSGRTGDGETRRQLLIRSRGTFGELAHHYKAQTIESVDLREIEAEEEYYTLACLGAVICTSDLGDTAAASDDLSRYYGDWTSIARLRCKTLLDLDNPARLLDARYVASLPAANLVDMLDFAHRTEHGIGWIDTLRGSLGKATIFNSGFRVVDKQSLDYAKKLRARDEVLMSYAAHFAFLGEKKISATYFARTIAERLEREGAPLLWIAPVSLNLSASSVA